MRLKKLPKPPLVSRLKALVSRNLPRAAHGGRRARNFNSFKNVSKNRGFHRPLDAAGNVPRRRRDVAAPGRVVKKFEMVNVHVRRLNGFYQIRCGAERSN
jgi:hypothetical protein